MENNKMKYFNINKKNQQISLSLSKKRKHPIILLALLLNKNSDKLDYSSLTDSEKDELFDFLKQLEGVMKDV